MPKVCLLCILFLICLSASRCFPLIVGFRFGWRSSTKCDCKIDWLWVRSPLEKMKYVLKFIFPFLRSGVEAKRDVLPLNTQCLQNLSESEERSVLILGSLCLLCCEGYSVNGDRLKEYPKQK